MATWPVTLPQSILADGYSETLPDTVIRTSMDVGPAKVRRRISNNSFPIVGTLVISRTQVGYLKTFYNTTLLGGSLAFDWADPTTRATVSMRFTGPPKISSVSGWYKVDMALEVLP
jgi:hypothetical protein